MNALGLTSVRALMASWAVSAVILVVGLLLVITGSTAVGLPVFVVGAAGSLMTAFFMLRLRAGDAGARRRRTPQ